MIHLIFDIFIHHILLFCQCFGFSTFSWAMIKIDLKRKVTLALTCSYIINSGVQFEYQSCDELSESGLTELDKKGRIFYHFCRLFKNPVAIPIELFRNSRTLISWRNVLNCKQRDQIGAFNRLKMYRDATLQHT